MGRRGNIFSKHLILCYFNKWKALNFLYQLELLSVKANTKYS